MKKRNLLASGILLLGAALRFYKLSEFPFHPDEAIHAWFALSLGSYSYDPTYHGPLLYHLVAAVFGLFGASDFTARLVPALLGVILLWLLMWPGRRFLGTTAALWSGALLALSPVVVAYSRRLLHDSLVLVLTLGAVYCFQLTLEEPSTSRTGRNARIGLAAILTLFLATKVNAFFIMTMLLAFWVFARATKRVAKSTFDWLTPLFCIATALLIWAALYRGDALNALPKMLHYWSGQQKTPRLPGPHDYYLRLMLLYELPLVLCGVYGACVALRRRTPFTNLLLWWAFSSLVLYGVANEKVPWLLAHQMLPLCLLGGYGLAQLNLSTALRRCALIGAVSLGSIFLLRHIIATNWEHAAERQEPLLFAQTTETYRDTLYKAVQSTASETRRGIWVEPGQQWPAAWYLRPKAPILSSSPVFWDAAPRAERTLRVIICSPENWETLHLSPEYGSWHAVYLTRYVWPRPSWQALEPRGFIRFWATREATTANGVLSEDSTAPAIIAWKIPTKTLAY
jgi:uncharacterized protein (TIGR03663 family)